MRCCQVSYLNNSAHFSPGRNRDFSRGADRYIKDHSDDVYKLTEAQAFFQRHNEFVKS